MPGDYATIQEAMDAAAAGDTVFVSPGTYTGVNEFEFHPGYFVEAVVIMKPGVTLYGRPDAAEAVVIQATDSTQGIFCQGADSTTTIVGVTVTGGRSGFLGRHASPTISHCRFVGNRSAEEYNSGGGMYGDYFSPIISDCLFADNLAESGGGATFANESFPVLQRCVFTGNHARTTANNQGHGGALTITQESGAQLFDCTITGNEADDRGGAFWLSEAAVRLENVLVADNTCGDEGGAFFATYLTTVELVAVTMTGNEAVDLGGGVYAQNGATINATSSLLSGNVAPDGADGYLVSGFEAPLVTLICCSIDPDGWTGDELVIDDTDCD